jgi:hypothetical protein
MRAGILVQIRDAGGVKCSGKSTRRHVPKPVVPLGRHDSSACIGSQM